MVFDMSPGDECALSFQHFQSGPPTTSNCVIVPFHLFSWTITAQDKQCRPASYESPVGWKGTEMQARNLDVPTRDESIDVKCFL